MAREARCASGRRKIIAAVVFAGSALAALSAAEAQPAAKAYTIGFLSSGSPGPTLPYVQKFEQSLRDLGYVEGQTLLLSTDGRKENLIAYRSSSADLVRRNVDLEAGGQ